MELRAFLAAVAVTLTSLSAQNGQPQGQPAGTPAAGQPAAQGQPAGQGQAAKQDPDKPVQSPEERMAELQKEKDRLQQEIGYVRDRASKASTMLLEKFARRELKPKSINAGVSVTATPTATTMFKKARLWTPEETKAYAADVLMTVSGRAIKKAQIDDLIAYQKTMPQGNDEARAMRAVLDVLRTEASLAALQGSTADAERMAKELHEKAEKGADIVEISKANHGEVNLGANGVVEITRNTYLGLELERQAFQTKPGGLSPVFATPSGYAFLHVDKFVKGEQPETDRVLTNIVLVPFAKDPKEVQQVHAAVATGQVDISVRDEATSLMLPPTFRPEKVAPVGTDAKAGDAKGGDAKPEAKKVEEVKKG